jgi:hypothetical protein
MAKLKLSVSLLISNPTQPNLSLFNLKLSFPLVFSKENFRGWNPFSGIGLHFLLGLVLWLWVCGFVVASCVWLKFVGLCGFFVVVAPWVWVDFVAVGLMEEGSYIFDVFNGGSYRF